MFSWIIQISIISIIFIFLVHHLICFFKSTLTVPKMKDLVNSPIKKYQDIFDTISQGNSNTNSNTRFNGVGYLPTSDVGADYTDINSLPTENINSGNDMKDELKTFLKKQLNTSINEVGFGQEFGSAF